MHQRIALTAVLVGFLATACGKETAANDLDLLNGGQGGTDLITGSAGTYTLAGTGSVPAPMMGGTGGTLNGAIGGNAAKAGAGGAIGNSGSNGGTGGTPSGSGSDEKFSFFVTSLDAMRNLSNSEKGFGGDLRFGETTGLAGADKICTTIAEIELPGSGSKQWHAFLSTTLVNAKTRIGVGPWYDRLGRLVALNLTDLLKARPYGANTAIYNDLPDESGASVKALGDTHDILTGTNSSGDYDGRGLGNTCNDWTSAVGSTGKPTIGHSWPRGGGGGGRGGDATSWLSSHTAPGCAPGVNLVDNGAGSGNCVGCAGGYGAIYCFAMTP